LIAVIRRLIAVVELIRKIRGIVRVKHFRAPILHRPDNPIRGSIRRNARRRSRISVEDTPELYKKRMQENATKTLGAIASAARTAGVACETIQVENEHPYQAIIDTARSKGCDLIVMASHGRRGVSAIVLGSETVKVLTHSKIPVLVHR
jgi:nucleotide-binding universal stress UspA family protein